MKGNGGNTSSSSMIWSNNKDWHRKKEDGNER